MFGDRMEDAVLLKQMDIAIHAWVERCALDRMILALTPSSVTKAALIGEFTFSEERFDGDGKPYSVNVTVPWTTTKEIMMAIRKLALIDANATRDSGNG